MRGPVRFWPLALILLTPGCTAMESLWHRLGLGDEPAVVEPDAGGPEAAFKCPVGTQKAGGAFPEAADRWWRMAPVATSDQVLADAWPFSGWRSMVGGDLHLACAGTDGAWNGPYLQLRRDGGQGPEAQVEGSFAMGKPEGTWKGFWPLATPAFVGSYEKGMRTGTWQFMGPPDAPRFLAQGLYQRDRMTGTWTLEDDRGTTQARLVAGRSHGSWSRQEKSGTLVEGQYFDGQKHGAWRVSTLGADGARTAIQAEYWNMGVLIEKWDPRSEAPRGPDPQAGEKGAMEMVRSYLRSGLGGGWADDRALLDLPVLNDYADPAIQEQVGRDGLPMPASRGLVKVFSVESSDILGNQGTVSIRLPVLCEVGPNGVVSGAPATLTFEVRRVDGVWKPLRPPGGERYLYKDAFVKGLPSSQQTLADEIGQRCGRGDPLPHRNTPAPAAKARLP